MKKILVILSFAFCFQVNAQVVNEYLSVCVDGTYKKLAISINDEYSIEDFDDKKYSLTNNTFLFKKVNEFEIDGWVLLTYEFNRFATSASSYSTCAFMKRTAAATEEK